MRYASIHMATAFEKDYWNNRLFFDCPRNNDGLFNVFSLLRGKMLEYGVELNTPDIERPVEFEVYIDGRSKVGDKKKYLLALENPLINRYNGTPEYLAIFDKVFTSQKDIGIQLMYPSNIKFSEFNQDREMFSCMIASNKSGIQYEERRKVIDWYGDSKLFNLYGNGWTSPSWKGEIPYKKDVLENAVFCWCYENSQQENYITEKIFDCFTTGCIPIYWGAPNVTDYIPSNCFIDRRNFDSISSTHDYLLNISKDEICEFQENIMKFLETDAYIFSDEHYANEVARQICG